MWKKPGFVFLISLTFGLVIGWFVIAWWLFPGTWENATIEDLRADLKSDYIKLVVASYSRNQDVNAAAARLRLLNDPQGTLQDALVNSSEVERAQLLEFQTHFLQVAAENPAVEEGRDKASLPAARTVPYAGYAILGVIVLGLA